MYELKVTEMKMVNERGKKRQEWRIFFKFVLFDTVLFVAQP